MRSLLLVGLLVVTLIVGILVVRNMRTETADGSKKTESIDRARQAKDQVEGAAEEAAKRMKEAGKLRGDKLRH
ncbi:MAG: hypothetical protein R6X08_04065 [Desulfosalsimonadaceae bacterium]